MSRVVTKSMNWHVSPAKTQTSLQWADAHSDQSLHCALNEKLRILSIFKRTVKTLIRLGGCPGWSESLLGAQTISLVISRCGSFDLLCWPGPARIFIIWAHLFQQSIDTGEIIKEWSLANTCPLFKKSDRSLACNYRPVSLTCVPCKLLEHIVCSNIMPHLDEYKLLSDRQHAFRKGHSCETQLTTVINEWAKILDNRGQVDTFILDFEKAFDTPPHELLKSILFSYGIGGKTLKWIDSFLCFRQQRVVVNGVKSDWAPVLSGVPQGTVLGPLLFSLYINDISSDIEFEIRVFADNCVCYREIKDEKDTMKLQRDIDRLGSWAKKWGMRFQPVKCNMVQLTRKRIKKIHASYTLEGTNLENVESIKYLGVTITSDLRWNTHLSNVCTKAIRTLGFLRRNLYSCPQEVKEAAYKGLVRHYKWFEMEYTFKQCLH